MPVRADLRMGRLKRCGGKWRWETGKGEQCREEHSALRMFLLAGEWVWAAAVSQVRNPGSREGWTPKDTVRLVILKSAFALC